MSLLVSTVWPKKLGTSVWAQHWKLLSEIWTTCHHDRIPEIRFSQTNGLTFPRKQIAAHSTLMSECLCI